jgi:hypothetical protein
MALQPVCVQHVPPTATAPVASTSQLCQKLAASPTSVFDGAPPTPSLRRKAYLDLAAAPHARSSFPIPMSGVTAVGYRSSSAAHC